MGTKAAIGILGLIVAASFGVGVLVGMQLGGTGPSGASDAAPGTATPAVTETPAETETDARGGTAPGSTDGTATANPSATPERRTSIPARRFDRIEVAAHVVEFVNEERRARDLQAFSAEDTTAERVADMAHNHSVAMADAGSVAQVIEGVDTVDRYRDADLYHRCKFSPDGNNVVRPDAEFEVVGRTYAGTEYRADGETRFNGDERAVARAVVDAWFDDPTFRERLLMETPTRLGVGVEVTTAGKAYVTANLCD